MPYLQNMCPAEFEKAVKDNLPLLISAGSIEYHASQLPLGTDLLIIEGVLREIEKWTPVVIAPPFTFSPTGYMVSGPDKGTVDVSIDCFISHCAEILTAYKKMGFRNIKVLVHHQGGNIGTLIKTAVMKVNAYNLYQEQGCGWWTDKKGPEKPCKIEVVPAIFGGNASKVFDGHAGRGETNAILALYPDLVHMENLTENEPWWNASVKDANQEEANREMEKLITAWVEMLNQ